MIKVLLMLKNIFLQNSIFALSTVLVMFAVFVHRFENNFFLTASDNFGQGHPFFIICNAISSFLFFLVGSIGMYAVAFVCGAMMYFYFFQNGFYPWERFFALFCLPFCIAILSSLASFQQLQVFSFDAGGIVGFFFASLLKDHASFCDYIIQGLFFILILLIYQCAYIEGLLFVLKTVLFQLCAFFLFFYQFLKGVVSNVYRMLSSVTKTDLQAEDSRSKQKEVFGHIQTDISTNHVKTGKHYVVLNEKKSGYHPCLAAAHFTETVVSSKMEEQAALQIDQKIVVLEKKLACFGIEGHVTEVHIGPILVLFEYQPAIDIKLSKIMALEDDLAMALESVSTRILAPIPGKAVVGFEVAHTARRLILFADLFVADQYCNSDKLLPLILGVNVLSEPVIVDLAVLPHLLLAGSTGSGKSVVLNTMLVSLLHKNSFDKMKLILIDPKRLEFSVFADIPHLLFPIVTEAPEAVRVLKWVVQEMEDRYEKMAACGARSLYEFNQMHKNKGSAMPFVVIVIDEFSDLILTAGKELETLIIRIAQMARASGIHMIIATQRPSVDVVTGIVKANFPARICLRVASRVDSRTVLDVCGAERLLTKGDMLFLNPTAGTLDRIHGSYFKLHELESFLSCIRKLGSPSYIHCVETSVTSLPDMIEDSDFYKEVITFVKQEQAVSISLLQRRFRIGFNRSARIIELLEKQGIIMPIEGSKLRRVVR